MLVRCAHRLLSKLARIFANLADRLAVIALKLGIAYSRKEWNEMKAFAQRPSCEAEKEFLKRLTTLKFR